MYAIQIVSAPWHSTWTINEHVDRSGEGVALSYQGHSNLKPQAKKLWRTEKGAENFMNKIRWKGFHFKVVKV